MSLKTTISFVSALALPLAGMTTLLGETDSFAKAATPAIKDASPAMCGKGDAREPGIQGDVPAGLTSWNYNCGVKLVSALPLSGNVQGVGTCAYVRTRGEHGSDGIVHVIDTSNPTKPVEVRTIPVLYGSESMRVVIAKDRSLLVSGSSVYDIKDCLNPVLKGEIKWPPLSIGIDKPLGGGGGSGILPHDLRVNHAGTKVYGAMGLWEVDISNLNDPTTWKITDYRCDLAPQVPGPWQAIHQIARANGLDLCVDAAKPDSQRGANWRMGASSAQTSLLWPTLSHSPDVSGDDKLVFLGDQAGGTSGRLAGGAPKLRIVDVTQHPVKIVGVTDGPGHGLDWFQTGGRQYVLHSNEVGTGGGASLVAGGALGQGGRAGTGGVSAQASAAVNMASDTCKPYPRPTGLGWAFDAVVSDVTDPTAPHNLTQLRIAINNPENCEARKASGRDPTVAYHLIDDAFNAHFAMVNFGSAGLRIYDIRNPANPIEVAYYNNGVPVHAGVGAYDAKRGLIYASAGGQFLILALEPQVKAKLGL